MTTRCANCAKWLLSQETHYGDGRAVVMQSFPQGEGLCRFLSVVTGEDFSCAAFEPGGDDDHVELTTKQGSAWQHFVMVSCPECAGAGSQDSACHRCAGTGNVRRYDDGFVGDEQTRMHPKEKELGTLPTPRCFSCGTEVQPGWVACPNCGARIGTPPAQTEVIDDAASMAVGG